jgi:hypothetical protein
MGFIVTILIRLILYIIYIVPIILPLNPLPTLLTAIARGFLILFHIGIWSPSTLYCHLNLLPSPSPFPLLPPPIHTLYLLYSLVFVINM